MAIKLSAAHLCLDCESIFDKREFKQCACPVCGSRATWALWSWLNPHLTRYELTEKGAAALAEYKSHRIAEL